MLGRRFHRFGHVYKMEDNHLSSLTANFPRLHANIVARSYEIRTSSSETCQLFQFHLPPGKMILLIAVLGVLLLRMVLNYLHVICRNMKLIGRNDGMGHDYDNKSNFCLFNSKLFSCYFKNSYILTSYLALIIYNPA